MSEVRFDDNRRVKRHKDWSEYLNASVLSATEERPETCCINRYCLPGRVDSYSFCLRIGMGHSLGFYSDTNLSLEQGLKQAKEDLDRPQIVEMFQAMRRKAMTQDLKTLVGLVAPKSKTSKMLQKIKAAP